MPNGKGFLDCRYCVFAWPLDGKWPLLFGSRTRCMFHQSDLPSVTAPGHHRFCVHFQPSELFFSESPLTMFRPIAAQFARLGAELAPGVLYEFNHYSKPPQTVQQLAVLRIPDYQDRCWKPVA